jgi:hypothetical protein
MPQQPSKRDVLSPVERFYVTERPDEEPSKRVEIPQLEYFGYGDRWFDRMEARRRRGLVIVVAFGLVGALFMVAARCFGS